MKTLREMMDLIESAQAGVAEAEKKPHPQTWHDVDPKLGKAVDKMSQAEKVKKGLAHPDTLKKKGVAEGTANLEKALDTLRGSWSGWIKDEVTNPNIESYWFDDGEGGHDASGSIQHDLRTGKITVDYEDEYGEKVKGTFDSVGAAMNALRGGYPGSHGSGKAPNFDTLGGREFDPSKDLYKTDRAGKKGTLTKAHMDTMKASSPYRMRGGPKGPLPEGVAEGSLNEGQYEMMMRNGQVKKFVAKDDADAKRIAAGHGAKSVIRLRGGVPAGKVSEQGVAEGEKKPHPQTWHDVDPKLGKQVDKMSQAEKVKKGFAHPDTLKKKGVAEEQVEESTPDALAKIEDLFRK